MFTYPMTFMGERIKNFPQVQSTASNNNTAATTSQNVTVPSGITPGDLLLLFIALDANAPMTLSGLPAGWISIHSSMDASNNDVWYEIFYKIADGAETNFTITSSQSQESLVHTMRIDSWHGSAAPEVGTSVQASSTQPNPPSLTPSWGSDKTLWVASFASDPGTRTISSYPLNYDDNQHEGVGSGVGGVMLGIATRELIAASENPGVFTKNVADEYTAQTVAVRP